MASRRAALAPLSVFHPSPDVAPESLDASSLHSGQRLANPGFPGFSSNSSPQATQVLIGNAIPTNMILRESPRLRTYSGKKVRRKVLDLNSKNTADTMYPSGPDGTPHLG